MDTKLNELLLNNDVDGVKDYFLEKEMEYYDNDMADIIIPLDRVIPGYDCLVQSIGIQNTAIFTDLYTDENAMWSVNGYETDIAELYFITKEEFALDDGYGVESELRFTASLPQTND